MLYISSKMNKLLEDYSKKPIIPIGKVNGATESEYYDYEFSSSDDEYDNGLQTQYEENFVAQEMRKYAHHSEAVRYFTFYGFEKVFTVVYFFIAVYIGLSPK